MATDYGHAALNAEVGRLSATREPGRNHALNVASMNLHQIVAAGHLTGPEIVDALLSACHTNGLYADDGEKACRATIRSGANGAGKHPRATVPLPGHGSCFHGPSLPQIPVPEEPGSRPGRNPPGPVLPIGSEDSGIGIVAIQTIPEPTNWDTLWAAVETENWIIEPLIAVGAQTVLYSPPKMGKSLLALEIAARLAHGNGQLLGVTITRPWNVVYIDHENRPVADIRKRLIDMGYTPPMLTHLHLYSFPKMPKLDTTMGGLMLTQMAQNHQADLVIIDTASRTIQGEENSNDTWVQWYANTGVLLKAAGIALLRLDHTGKDEERGQRGGSAKSSDVDMVWRMACVVPDQVFTLQCDASRMENNEKLLTLKREHGPLRHAVDGAGLMGALDARRAAMLALLDHTEAPKDIGVVEATTWLRDRGYKVPNGAITKRMLLARKLGTG